MKSFLVVMVIFICEICCFADNDYGIPKDISKILKAVTQHKLEENEEAFQRFIYANKRIIKIKNDSPVWFDTFVVANLRIVMEKYPKARCALTAKFYLAQIYLANVLPEMSGHTNGILILKSIIKNHSDKWEAEYAKVMLATMDVLSDNKKKEGIQILKGLLLKAEGIEANYKKKKGLVLYKKSIEAKPLDLMILDILYAKDNDNKQIYSNKIKTKYPNSHSAKLLKNEK